MLCLSALPPPRSFLLLPSSTDLRVHTLGLHVLFWNSTCVLLRLLLLLLLVLLRPSKVPALRFQDDRGDCEGPPWASPDTEVSLQALWSHIFSGIMPTPENAGAHVRRSMFRPLPPAPIPSHPLFGVSRMLPRLTHIRRRYSKIHRRYSKIHQRYSKTDQMAQTVLLTLQWHPEARYKARKWSPTSGTCNTFVLEASTSKNIGVVSAVMPPYTLTAS